MPSSWRSTEPLDDCLDLGELLGRERAPAGRGDSLPAELDAGAQSRRAFALPRADARGHGYEDGASSDAAGVLGVAAQRQRGEAGGGAR